MPEESWTIAEGPTEISPADADSRLYRYEVERGDESATIIVAISNSLMASGPEGLDFALGENVATAGKVAVLAALKKGATPERITISSAGIIEGWSPVHFIADDIMPIGHEPDSTAQRYEVTVGGESWGVVRVPGAPGLINAGQDVRAYIAEKLNALQRSEGVQRVRESVGAMLTM